MATLKIWLVSLSLFLIAVLSVQNAAPAVLRLFVWQSVSIPLGVMMTLSLCVGMILSLIIFPVKARP